jgi:2,4-dienoyl-CoA reductase-like NADH-dependent reductase (Old Yellow Enzyme family)/thioredoxin reductase
MPAMGTNYADPVGAVTDQLLNYYTERAKGGVGLIIIEVTCVDSPIGKTIANQLCVHEDRLVPGLRALAESIQSHGAKVALQLHHAGRRAHSKITGFQPVGPSAIACYGGDIPRELTEEQIEEIVEKFVQGARRAKEAGFDAVEVHCAHGYLIHQFLSPLTNKRLDVYGGELLNRTRFACRVIQRIRKEAGQGYPIFARISGDEFIPGGLTLAEGKVIAQELERAGANLIHVSAGGTPSSSEEYEAQRATSIPDMSFPRGCFVHLAQGIKESVRIPVIAVGRINGPDLAEEILRQGNADLVAMGRVLIADPDMPRKIREENWEGIRRCIACMTCVDKILLEQSPLVCTVNPAAGKEKDSRIIKTKTPKAVLIAGGGPGGMEAARVLALRGHRVTLMEKGDQLGGQLRLAVLPPHKEELKSLLNYLSGQIKELGVKVELRSAADMQTIAERNAEAVIIATGAKPIIPQFAGIDKANVFGFAEALSNPSIIGEKVIVLGGGLVGCETAEFLAQAGRSVTILEMLKDLALDVSPFVRKFLLRRLTDLKISMVVNTKALQIHEGHLIALTNGQRRSFPADSFVLAMGLEADQSLSDAFKTKLPVYYNIGDCVKPRRIIDAIHEGFSIGQRL